MSAPEQKPAPRELRAFRCVDCQALKMHWRIAPQTAWTCEGCGRLQARAEKSDTMCAAAADMEAIIIKISGPWSQGQWDGLIQDMKELAEAVEVEGLGLSVNVVFRKAKPLIEAAPAGGLILPPHLQG